MRKKITAVFLCFALFGGGCAQNRQENADGTEVSVRQNEVGVTESRQVTTTAGITIPTAGSYSKKALDPSYGETDATKIQLLDDKIEVNGDGASAENCVVTITKKGTYLVTGKLSDGQIVVDLQEDENVHMILQDVELACSDYAPLIVESVKNLYLTLADGSENTISDGTDYALKDETDETCAAIYAKDDLIVNGNGSLTVNGNYKDGIHCRDDLTIVSGNLSVNAKEDALLGHDSVTIRDGSFDIVSNGDGIKASKQGDARKGYVIIDGGEIKIDAGDDAIHSETSLVVNDGTMEILRSNEGLESLNIVINGGKIDITSSDDGINVAGGEGILTDTTSEAGNDTQMREPPEFGAEGGDKMPPEFGTEDGDKMPPEFGTENGDKRIPDNGGGRLSDNQGRREAGVPQMGGGMDEAIDGALIINGGTIHVTAQGDAIDSNGSIRMTGGSVTAWGPSNGGNGVLDFSGTFEMAGGTLVAGCIFGMNQAPSAGSTQESFAVKLDDIVASGSEVVMKDETGDVLYTAEAGVDFNYLVVSLPEIKTGETYVVEADGQEVKITGGDISAAGFSKGGF